MDFQGPKSLGLRRHRLDRDHIPPVCPAFGPVQKKNQMRVRGFGFLTKGFQDFLQMFRTAVGKNCDRA